jgi:hypothetical protein
MKKTMKVRKTKKTREVRKVRKTMRARKIKGGRGYTTGAAATLAQMAPAPF